MSSFKTPAKHTKANYDNDGKIDICFPNGRPLAET
jgi:hypothetical protein